jgi:hypothetical protein
MEKRPIGNIVLEKTIHGNTVLGPQGQSATLLLALGKNEEI